MKTFKRNWRLNFQSRSMRILKLICKRSFKKYHGQIETIFRNWSKLLQEEKIRGSQTWTLLMKNLQIKPMWKEYKMWVSMSQMLILKVQTLAQKEKKTKKSRKKKKQQKTKKKKRKANPEQVLKLIRKVILWHLHKELRNINRRPMTDLRNLKSTFKNDSTGWTYQNKEARAHQKWRKVQD